MPPAIIKLVAMLLLVVQGLIALAPGRVLCIPVRDCGTHQSEVGAACDHCASHTRLDASSCSDDPGTDHGSFPAAFHPEDECGCHLHVPVPGSEQVPNNAKNDGPDLRTLIVPLVVAIIWVHDANPPLAASPHFRPPDFSVSDQVLSLKSTRLLI